MEPDEAPPNIRAVRAADQEDGRYAQFIGADAPEHDPFTNYPLEQPFDLGLFVAMAVPASLAHNMAVRRQKIWDCWGTSVVVGWIGNAAHQAECSDHNKDATGVVHAIDPMVTGARAKAIVAAALAHPDDLQYVIHNRTIWSINTDWDPRAYTGSDPHTNHVHLSGRHGSAHRNSATCTGYNLVAQSASPTFDICPEEEDDMTTVELGDASIAKLAAATAKATVDELLTRDLGKPGGGDTVGIVLQSGVLYASKKIVEQLDEISAKLTPETPNA
jgi:hypothetical protein